MWSLPPISVTADSTWKTWPHPVAGRGCTGGWQYAKISPHGITERKRMVTSCSWSVLLSYKLICLWAFRAPLRGICPWIMWFCYLMMNYKSQACEWTLNISFRAFLKNFPFFEFLFLFITPNSAKKYTRNTNFSIFPLGACSKIPKPKQCTPGKTLPSWCQHRNLFAPKHKILMAGLKVC